MGTSTGMPRPDGTAWKEAEDVGKQWARGEADEATFGDKCLAALSSTVTSDPDAFGVAVATEAAGRRLINTLDDLSRGLGELVDLTSIPRSEREDAFVIAFVTRVAGSGTLVVDGSIRQSVRKCAERLLAEPDVKRAVREADGSASITDEIFCSLYRFFFGTVVGDFITTLIAAKVLLAAPVLKILPFGSGDVLAHWIAQRVLAVILSPCEEKKRAGNEDRPLADLGRELLGEVVRRALGIDTSVTESAGDAA